MIITSNQDQLVSFADKLSSYNYSEAGAFLKKLQAVETGFKAGSVQHPASIF